MNLPEINHIRQTDFIRHMDVSVSENQTAHSIGKLGFQFDQKLIFENAYIEKYLYLRLIE